MSATKPRGKTKSKRRAPPGPVGDAASEGTDRLALLAEALRAHPDRPVTPRTAKLLAAGVAKMAQKVVEEAAEVAIDAVRAEREAVVRESADLLYNLTVLLTELDIHPTEVWREMDRRREILGIAEKLPKPLGEEKREDPDTSGSDPSPSPSPASEARS